MSEVATPPGLREFGRNAVLTFGRQVLVVVFGIALTVFLARALGPTGNGQYAVAILLPALLASALNLGVAPANVYYVGRGEVSVRTAFRATFGLWVLLCSVGMVLGALIVAYRGPVWFPAVPEAILWLGLAMLPIALLRDLLASLLQATRDFRRYNTLMVAGPTATLIMAVLLVWVMEWGVLGAVLASFFGAFAGFSAALSVIRLRAAGTEEKVASRYARACVGYGWKAHLSNVLTFVNYRADILLLNLLLSPAATGIYVVAVQIAERLWILSQAVSTVLLPQLAYLHTQEDQGRRLTPLIARWVLLLSICGATIMCLLAAPVIDLLFGPAFAAAAAALLWLLPGVVVGGVARVLANDLAARGRPELNLYASIIVVAINITGNLLLIPRFGITGAAIATSIAYSANAIIKIVLYSRLSGVRCLEALVTSRADYLLAKRAAGVLIGRGQLRHFRERHPW